MKNVSRLIKINEFTLLITIEKTKITETNIRNVNKRVIKLLSNVKQYCNIILDVKICDSFDWDVLDWFCSLYKICRNR